MAFLLEERIVDDVAKGAVGEEDERRCRIRPAENYQPRIA
jgi:hypothetical protein